MTDATREQLVMAVGEHAAARVLQDASWLGRLLDPAVIHREYVAPILGGDRGAVAELFVAARLATTATCLTPHVAGHGNKRCDAQAVFGGAAVFVEVKRQRDDFPFNRPGTVLEIGVSAYAGSRPGADPRFLGDPPANTTDPLPGASIWRGALEEAAAQLPRGHPGIIAVQCEATGDLDIDTCDALFGDMILVAKPHPRGWGSITEEGRLANGFFSDERFRHVAGVWFFRLSVDWSEAPAVLRADWARGARNPTYVGEELAEELAYALLNVHDQPLRPERDHRAS